MKILRILYVAGSIALSAITASAGDTRITAIYMRLVSRPEVIEYLECSKEGTFPESFKGKEVSYRELDTRKFKLSRLIDVSFGENPIIVPWGIKSRNISYNWREIEVSFENEIRKINGLPPISASEEKDSENSVKHEKDQKLANEDLAGLRKMSSITCVADAAYKIRPVMIMAGKPMLLEQAMGEGLFFQGYNPFLGVSYVDPKSSDRFYIQVADTVSRLCKDTARSRDTGALFTSTDALAKVSSTGKLDVSVVKYNIIPSIVFNQAIPENRRNWPQEIVGVSERNLEKLSKRLALE